jgi:VWFA-related protein
MTSRVALIVVITAAVFADLSAQQAQPTPQPVFKNRTELTQFDAVVVDAQGRPILGLEKSDFVLIDRNTPQVIDAFEEVSYSPVPAAPKLDVSDNASALSTRVIVIGLDDLHVQGKTEAIRNMARRVVERIGSSASLALVTTSGTFGVGPTADRSLLLGELDRFIDKFDPETRRAVNSPLEEFFQTNAFSDPPFWSSRPRDVGSFRSNLQSFKTIEDVARRIGTDDRRRKAMVWISGGIPTPGLERCRGNVRDRGSDGDHACMAAASVMNTLRRWNIVTYAVNTGDRHTPFLKEMTEGSGGFTIDMKSFDEDLDRLINDLDHYYLLGFRPTNPGSRDYRGLEVRVNVPGATVRVRPLKAP